MAGIDKKYNEPFNYPSFLFLIVNDARISRQAGHTGTIELEELWAHIPDELQKTIKEEIENINKECETQQQELFKAWKIPQGHPSNNKFIVELTPARQAQLDKTRTLANQKISHAIINMMYKNGILLTNASNMPSSLVR